MSKSETGRAAAGSAARRERAERILDAAAGLLRQHGYRRVSIDDVAAAARVGKGTIYLHWKTREALFWAALQREAMRLMNDLAGRLAADPGLTLPHRLMPAVYLEVLQRPLVQALLITDADVLGALAEDESVAAAQREVAGNPDYLELVARHGLLRDGLDPARAGYLLGSVMRGFFLDPDTESPGALPAPERAELLGDVLARTLEADGPVSKAAVTALAADVIDMFRGITAKQREQLERAY